jgi:multidrug resistance protein, MATE family
MSAPNGESTLAWEHRPGSALIALAGPTTLSLLSFAFMGVVDTLLVSKLGSATLAGVGVGIVITQFLGGFGFGLLRGEKILLAQARGDHERGRVLVGAGLLLGVQLGLAMLVLGELAALIVPHFCATPEAGAAARAYLAVRSLSYPVVMVYVALREARYGYGETRSPLISAIAGNTTHALLDWIAIYALGWGAAGAGLAGSLAFVVQAVLLAFAQRETGVTFGPAAREARVDVARTGAFTGLQFVLETGSLAALSLLLAGMSNLQMAAHQIAVQLAAFCFLPALAIAESATVLTAEAYGRARYEAVHAVARAARKLGLAYSVLCALVLLAGGGVIAGWFTREPALVALARSVLGFVAAYQLFESLALGSHGVLRGVGAARFSAICGMACAWLCTPWLGYLLARHYELGAVGVWIAHTVELAVASLVLARYVERGSWQRARPGQDRLRESFA